MNIFRSAALAVAAGSLACVSLLAQSTPTQASTLHVFASNGMRAVVEQLQPECQRTIGHPLAIEYGSTAGLMKKIESGAPFDVAILTSDAIATLVKENKLDAGTRADLARSGIGVGIRKGSPKPNIATAEAFKQTLLAAKSITYARDGASAVYLVKIYDRLGITNEVNSKLILTDGSGPATAKVAAGEATLVLTLISEIMPEPGDEVVGPLPAELQSYINFAIGAGSKTSNAEAARALIALLKGPTAAPVYKAKGMEQR
ncbi:MAG: substrate-binding domain-containing protein [Bryobacteraceae bacterium]|jgi:molybdate transport system substrate-binding protein